MGQRTALYERHVALGAKIVDFAGWDMPLHYGSQIEEHHLVRRAAGFFDVSHMAVVDVTGASAKPFLRRLLANDVGRLDAPGRALYTCLLREDGGVLDDLIVYFQSAERYRIVVNAATRRKDIAWFRRHAEPFGVRVDERTDLSMIAVQGPKARALCVPLLPADLREAAAGLAAFNAVWNDAVFAGCTGYTGEDGFEIMLPNAQADAFVQGLLDAGAGPAGLGARDTLRLEAGLNLYGSDMDETTTPLETGLAWTVAFEPAERDFVGRTALEAQKRAGVPRKRIGLVLEGKGVLRGHQIVHLPDGGTGEITSGSFAPTLARSIAFARVPAGEHAAAEVEIRGRRLPARVVRPPFVKNGKSAID